MTDTIGVSSTTKIRGMRMYLWMETNPRTSDGRHHRTIYHYRLPREELKKALDAGAWLLEENHVGSDNLDDGRNDSDGTVCKCVPETGRRS